MIHDPPIEVRDTERRLGRHRLAWALAFPLWLLACAPPVVPPPPESSFTVVQRAFGPGFFDAIERRRLFAPGAADALVLPSIIDERRYRFLGVGELRREGPDVRVGEVAFSIDGWPTSLPIRLTRARGEWMISGVGTRAEQRLALDLLGPEGLPVVRNAEAWPGGLAARDATNRPTPWVLLLAWGEGLIVDGAPVEDVADEAVIAQVRAALEARAALARRARATYRPQVALALPRAAPAPMHAALAELATRAGAEVLTIVVRRGDGGPGQVPIARRVATPGALRPVARVELDLDRAVFTLGTTEAELQLGVGGADQEAARRVLSTLRRAEPSLAGAVLRGAPRADHGRIVNLLATLRNADADLLVATEPAP